MERFWEIFFVHVDLQKPPNAQTVRFLPTLTSFLPNSSSWGVPQVICDQLDDSWLGIDLKAPETTSLIRLTRIIPVTRMIGKLGIWSK